MKKLTLILIILFSSLCTFGQIYTMTGRVTGAFGNGINNVTVHAFGSGECEFGNWSTFGITNGLGYYIVENVQPYQCEITFATASHRTFLFNPVAYGWLASDIPVASDFTEVNFVVETP
jgi:hypothetical protein